VADQQSPATLPIDPCVLTSYYSQSTQCPCEHAIEQRSRHLLYVWQCKSRNCCVSICPASARFLFLAASTSTTETTNPSVQLWSRCGFALEGTACQAATWLQLAVALQGTNSYYAVLHHTYRG
jgi:hypothetical protein